MKLKLFLVSAALFISGCAAQNTYTNKPANVTDAQVNEWVSASNMLVSLTSATHSARQAVIAANQSGQFPDGPSYVATLNALGRVIQIKLQAEAFLQTVPNSFGQPVTARLADFATQIGAQLTTAQAQAALGIKNGSTASTVAKSIQAVVAAIQSVETLISQAKSAVSGTANNFSAPMKEVQFVFAT